MFRFMDTKYILSKFCAFNLDFSTLNQACKWSNAQSNCKRNHMCKKTSGTNISIQTQPTIPPLLKHYISIDKDVHFNSQCPARTLSTVLTISTNKNWFLIRQQQCFISTHHLPYPTYSSIQPLQNFNVPNLNDQNIKESGARKASGIHLSACIHANQPCHHRNTINHPIQITNTSIPKRSLELTPRHRSHPCTHSQQTLANFHKQLPPFPTTTISLKPRNIVQILQTARTLPSNPSFMLYFLTSGGELQCDTRNSEFDPSFAALEIELTASARRWWNRL